MADFPSTHPDEPFREILQLRDGMLAYAFTILHDWALAEDVVQESLVYVQQNPERYRGKGSRRAWFRGIVRNKSFEAIRRQSRERTLEDEELFQRMEQHWDEEDTHERLRQRLNALRDCLQNLKPKARSMLWQFYADKKPGKDVAEDHDVSHGHLRSQLHHLRSRMKACMEGKLSEGCQRADSGMDLQLERLCRGAADAMDRQDLLQAARSRGADFMVDYVLEWTAFYLATQVYEQLQQGLKDSIGNPLWDKGAYQHEPAQNRRIIRKRRSPSGTRSGTRPHSPRPPSSTLRPPSRLPRILGLSAAALFCMVLGAALYLRLNPALSPGNSRIQVTQLSGRSEWKREETWQRLRKGTALQSGDQLRSGNPASVQLTWTATENRVTVGPGSELDIELDDHSSMLTLSQGALLVDLPEASMSLPLLTRTPYTEARVRGTIYELSYDPKERMSLLEVIEGEVNIASIGGKPLQVSAGQRSVWTLVAGDEFSQGLRSGVGWQSPRWHRGSAREAQLAFPRGKHLEFDWKRNIAVRSLQLPEDGELRLELDRWYNSREENRQVAYRFLIELVDEAGRRQLLHESENDYRRWLERERIQLNLKEFAGQQVELSFQFVSDSNLNRMTLDDVRIFQIQ